MSLTRRERMQSILHSASNGIRGIYLSDLKEMRDEFDVMIGEIERLRKANEAAKRFYEVAYMVFGDPLVLASKYGPDFEPPTQDEIWEPGQDFIDKQRAADAAGGE